MMYEPTGLGLSIPIPVTADILKLVRRNYGSQSHNNGREKLQEDYI